MTRTFAIALLLSCPLHLAAETQVWLLGGGNTLETSQGQIEANVRWLEELLLANGLPVRTYFGRGDEPGADVLQWTPSVPAPHREAFARIFADPVDAHLEYRRHTLRALRGSTRKAELAAALPRDFAALQPNDELLLVFNGHGGVDRADTRNNYLKLWDDERLSVNDLEGLLDAVPPQTPTRFVMTQCYSGAFSALIYDNPAEQEGFLGQRCGFMAESSLRLAEGCELAVDQEDFRDYTTYFFAALSGATRLGEPLDLAAIDRDANGVVSYREAHFYALVAAHSADLSRSTSEEFLEQWGPWYLRLDSLGASRDSDYWRLADEVAAQYGWPSDSTSLARLRAEHAATQEHLDAARRAARRQAEALAAELRAELLAQWPELETAATLPPARAFEQHWAEIEQYLARDERYATLVREQDALGPIGRESLEHTRTVTQLEKVYRLRQLARLEAGLDAYGNATAKSRYAALQQCESGALTVPGEELSRAAN